MKKRAYPLRNVYRLLETGPSVLVTTFYKGKANVMTMSWHTMVDFEPPVVACIMSNRNYSFEMLRKSRECVLNIPTDTLIKKVVGCGSISARSGTDKFKKFSLTPKPARTVKAPLIDECYANLECKVIDSRLAEKYNLFFLKVTKAWVSPTTKHPRTLHHAGAGTFRVAGKTLTIPSRIK